ncbi:MAG: amino acid ABC transporter substrate-binding protein [Lachnospiraceae bacterium]|nr:amino acid ABC transporter substrate-binding protein [Lachnospiraceae bacterium]
MKTWKKGLAVIGALVMVFAMIGCAQTEDNKKAAAYDKALKELSYSDAGLKELTVAMSPDFAPMEFVDLSRKGTAQYVGFDVLLATFIAKELNMKLVIKPMSFDATQAAVQTGNVDLGISGFSWTEERAENYFITDWYEAGDNETEQVTITTAENKDKFKTAADYAGKKVGAQGASLQKILVEGQLPDAELVLYENLNDALSALLTGKIDALAVAYGNGEAFISANTGKIDFTGFEFVVDDLYKNNVILMNKNAAELGAKVNAALAKAKQGGYYDKWYEAAQMLAEIKTVDELGYDDNGNKITE